MQSEVANLRILIEMEFAAMHQGLNGLAAGTAKHQFIQARMKHVGAYKKELATHIGGEQATQFSCEAYTQMMEEKQQ